MQSAWCRQPTLGWNKLCYCYNVVKKRNVYIAWEYQIICLHLEMLCPNITPVFMMLLNLKSYLFIVIMEWVTWVIFLAGAQFFHFVSRSKLGLCTNPSFIQWGDLVHDLGGRSHTLGFIVRFKNVWICTYIAFRYLYSYHCACIYTHCHTINLCNITVLLFRKFKMQEMFEMSAIKTEIYCFLKV